MFNDITIRVASPEDQKDVQRVARLAYACRGYCSAEEKGDEEQQKYSFTIVAEVDGKIVGTASVLRDGEGIEFPIVDVFPGFMWLLHGACNKLWYFGQLAVDPDHWSASLVGVLLIKRLLEMALEEEVDGAVAVVNPRHEGFYKGMGFVAADERKSWPGLKKAPAVLMLEFIENLDMGFLDWAAQIGMRRAEKARKAATSSPQVTEREVSYA